jgi:hypothetical protein
MEHPDPEDILNFVLTIEPDEGLFSHTHTPSPPSFPLSLLEALLIWIGEE